jgi:hypothetical protein
MSFSRSDAYTVAQESTGAILGGLWHVPFYAHVDAFLAATRSVGEVINCCFGHDTNWRMKAWFESLTRDERDRRRAFSKEFEPHLSAYRDLPLSEVRHVSEHRQGFSDVVVTVTGMFGVTYTGGPTKQVATSEKREDMPPGMEWLAKARRVMPMWSDFFIDERNLFEAFKEHLNDAQNLIGVAREIAQRALGGKLLTPPR